MDNQLVLLLPFVILEFVLAITALIHVIKHPNYRFGNKPNQAFRFRTI